MSSLKAYVSIVLMSVFLLTAGCDSSITNEEKSTDKLETQNLTESFQKVTNPGLNRTLADVRSASAQFHDVDKAEAEGYSQASEFVPGMGYHYVNPAFVDAEINPTEPEALVYLDNPVDEDKRRLVAVEYIIPFAIIPSDTPHSEFDNKFPGVDGDKWHKEDEIDSWTLHAWIWYPNPDGVFHPTNPRIRGGEEEH
ncbi:hypothetical protein [Rhodohalobacter sp. 8-1]|uniref:hypothetical protein n=1 Tax=Rhodohalobacter sp. 8-1 TaxID=3131972 RepID=UPI0030EBFBBB